MLAVVQELLEELKSDTTIDVKHEVGWNICLPYEQDSFPQQRNGREG